MFRELPHDLVTFLTQSDSMEQAGSLQVGARRRTNDDPVSHHDPTLVPDRDRILVFSDF